MAFLLIFENEAEPKMGTPELRTITRTLTLGSRKSKIKPDPEPIHLKNSIFFHLFGQQDIPYTIELNCIFKF